MNLNLNKLSRTFHYPLESEREKLAVAAVQYLIYYPEIYDQVKDGWGNVSAEDVTRIGEKRNAEK